MHHQFDKITDMVTREAKEKTSRFVNLTCWSAVVAMKWAK